MPFSILILTLDEETNLQACLDSIPWCDDIVVLDSLSSDRTLEIARARPGVRVFQRAFDDFAGQRNWAMDRVEFAHPWVFHLDADERFTEPLRIEAEAAAVRDEASGYFVPSKMMFRGRWLRRAAAYPAYQMRLVKRGEMRFVQMGHGQRESDLKRGFGLLVEPYLHYNFAKGMSDWFEKHNRYSSQEASETLNEIRSGRLDWKYLIVNDILLRRRTLKKISQRLPGRPILKFLYMYFLKLGFLDGSAGLEYCALQAIYEHMIVIKVRELLEREKAAPGPAPLPQPAADPSPADAPSGEP